MDFIEMFTEHNRVLNRSSNTINSYNADLKQFFNFISDKKKNIKEIGSQDIRKFMVYLSMKNNAKSSIARKLSSIKRFFSFLLSQNIVDEDPTIILSSPKIGRFLPNVITSEEVRSIINVIDADTFSGKRDRAIVELLYSSGLRASEALSLKEKDISFNKRELLVKGKGSKERIAFYSDNAHYALVNYVPFKKAKFPNSPYLFVNRSGEKLSDRFLRKTVEKYSKIAGINKSISPHTFRHSFATLLMDSGISLKYIQDLLGHSSISSTQIYTHTSKEALRASYEKYGPNI